LHASGDLAEPLVVRASQPEKQQLRPFEQDVPFPLGVARFLCRFLLGAADQLPSSSLVLLAFPVPRSGGPRVVARSPALVGRQLSGFSASALGLGSSRLAGFR